MYYSKSVNNEKMTYRGYSAERDQIETQSLNKKRFVRSKATA